jgi:hypothetical protein
MLASGETVILDGAATSMLRGAGLRARDEWPPHSSPDSVNQRECPARLAQSRNMRKLSIAMF